MSQFAFVAAERANHAVARLCWAIGASVSGFYAWLRATGHPEEPVAGWMRA